MSSASRSSVRVCLLAASVIMVAAVGVAQSDVTSPSVRFDKGLEYLKSENISLIVEYVAKEGASKGKHTITAYYEMVQLANKKVDTTIFIKLGSGEEKQVATVIGREMSAKGLGAWLWYKVCDAAGKLEGCRSAGVIN